MKQENSLSPRQGNKEVAVLNTNEKNAILTDR